MAIGFNKISTRGAIALVHDILMAGLSFNVALYLRLGNDLFNYPELYTTGTWVFTLITASVFYLSGLYRGVWRYASIEDLTQIAKSVTLAVLFASLVLFLVTRLEDFPRSVPIINWFILMAMIGGPRYLYRMIKDRQFAVKLRHSDHKAVPVVLVGASDSAELFLRAIERDPSMPYRPICLLSEHKNRVGREIRGVNVKGTVEELKSVVEKLDSKPQKVILTRDDWPGEKVRELYDIVESLGLTLARLPKITDLKSGQSDKIEVRPIDVEDLLGRPQKALDKSLPKELINGKRVLVTGAGGSIGSELVRQISASQPEEIILLEASEYALYTIDMEISRKFPDIKRHAVICNIRERDTLYTAFKTYNPELVFHAAALKHVPLVEDNPLEGMLTNAVGSRNVADACVAHNVEAMVQISTDKAVNPTNVMGATKRVAESYTQALDLAENNSSCRFITVRFGNVLGSTGSVVPLFKKQLSAGGPLTVTHKDMNRYFMTVREAVELVLQAFVLAKKDHSLDGKICVLDMGEPVKILHLAEQMIRLAGFEPYHDVDIQFTGLRPGEKLFEEIFHGDEPPSATSLNGVLVASPRQLDLNVISEEIAKLESLSLEGKQEEALSLLKSIVPDFKHAPNK